MTDPASIELHVLAFLIERRLTENEAVAVVKVLKDDSSLGWMSGSWDSAWGRLPDIWKLHIENLVRRRVLAWMDKYQQKHSARCLFTGES